MLLRHYLAEPVDSELEAKIANYLRRIQGEHGGWPLVQDGAFDMSASVKAYFALKMIGDSVDAPHMVRAREAIRSRGGAANSQRLHALPAGALRRGDLARVPVLPVEIMLLPRWSPFHLNKISYWARTTIVPLMVLAALKPLREESEGRRHRRTVPGGSEVGRHDGEGAASELGLVHAVPRARHRPARRSSRCFRKSCAQRAIDAAVAFIAERLNGEDGLGAIYPPMANTVMMYDALG